MNYQNIAEIYISNDKQRERLRETVGILTDTQLNSLPDGEKWTIAQIVEHMSIVEENMTRICRKLLSSAEAEGSTASGGVVVSDNFKQKAAEIATMKVEAPERVQPTGTMAVEQSLSRMDENRHRLDELRPMFEAYDGTTRKFPHPFFGDLSAQEWLVLIGGHTARHIKQIANLSEKIEN
jgi:hypothetical protein